MILNDEVFFDTWNKAYGRMQQLRMAGQEKSGEFVYISGVIDAYKMIHSKRISGAELPEEKNE